MKPQLPPVRRGVLFIAGLVLLSLALPARGQPVPPAAATSSSAPTTDMDKAKKALDASRLWLEEAKRRLDGGNDKALGFITVALQKIEAAKGDLDRTTSEANEAAAAKAAREKAAADKAAADKVAAEKAARDKAAAEKAEVDRIAKEKQAARDRERAAKEKAALPK